MSDKEFLFCELNSGNLARAIAEVVGCPEEQIKQDVEHYIKPRLDFMYVDEVGIYFIFENKYVETEWKDMVSIHYINTSYEVKNTVMRIHLFSEKKIDSGAYLGCFTLRTIDDVRFMLSYIYPNWKKVYVLGADKLYVMTYKKKVHIIGKEIVFDTYPLFVQDNAVVKCAQASMISMTSYLHEKYDYNKIRILNIHKSYNSGKTKLFPSKGLTPPQMLEVFNSYGISTECQICYEDPKELRQYVDFCLESAVPVLLGILVQDKKGKGVNKHIIQIIGYATKNGKKMYVVYDDSGYYLRSIDRDGFVKAVGWNEIKKSISPSKSFVIYPVHEKIYLLFDDITEIFEDLSRRMKLKETLRQVGDRLKGRRILVVDNRRLKQFLDNEIILDDSTGERKKQEESIKEVLKESLPHYLWYCEFQTDNRNFIFFADPTYNNKTTKNIIINKEPIISKNILNLLSVS